MDKNTLTVHVGRLRKRLDSAGLTEFITTRFGDGYIIESGGVRYEIIFTISQGT